MFDETIVDFYDSDDELQMLLPRSLSEVRREHVVLGFEGATDAMRHPSWGCLSSRYKREEQTQCTYPPVR